VDAEDSQPVTNCHRLATRQSHRRERTFLCQQEHWWVSELKRAGWL